MARLTNSNRHQGFTLVELIMVIVLLGILAAVAAPRMFNTTDFYARGFHDETLAYLRYAQKTAIAQRRTVCVTFSAAGVKPGTVNLKTAAAAGTNSCPNDLTGPKGESPAKLEARAGVGYISLTATSFNFDGQGQPVTSAGTSQGIQTIKVENATPEITVETATGYVHE